jgi:hypothetical protein
MAMLGRCWNGLAWTIYSFTSFYRSAQKLDRHQSWREAASARMLEFSWSSFDKNAKLQYWRTTQGKNSLNAAPVLEFQ